MFTTSDESSRVALAKLRSNMRETPLFDPESGFPRISFREWIKEQPGFVAGYHAQDSQTLKSVSITVWESKDSMMALRDRTPPGGPVGITTDWQEIYDVVKEF